MGIRVSTRCGPWWGKSTLGALAPVEAVHPVSSDYGDCNTSVQHSNRAREKKLQHFLALLQQSNIVLKLASFLV